MDEQKTFDETQEAQTELLVATEETEAPAAEVTEMPAAEVTEAPAAKQCASCGTVIPEGMKFCPNCGEQYNPPVAGPVFCVDCGTAIPEGMKFCPNCGKPVNGKAVVAAAKPKSKKPIVFGAIGAALLAIIIGLVIFLMPPKEIPAADLVVSADKIELKEEEITTVSCTVYPQDATNKTVIWTSSDENVATVNELGSITAVGKGECVITAQCGAATKTINVTVKTKIDFKALYDAVDADVKYGWSVGSDGSFLSADTNVYNLDDYSNSSIWASIKEMNKTLGLPASLAEDMGQTTWSMGRQNQKFTNIGIEVTWTYHPDKGMEVTYKLLVE